MSDERQETIADIVDDIRAQNQGLPEDSYALSPLVCDLLSIADRIEAAAKREREAGAEAAQICGEIGEMVGREAACHQPVTDCNGLNAAAMRSALEKVRRVLHCAIVADILKGDDVNGAFNEVIASLSAPPRNCDIGTAYEQAKRFRSFCKKFQSDIQGMCSHLCQCIDCSDKCHCMTKWSQMPYEGGCAE